MLSERFKGFSPVVTREELFDAATVIRDQVDGMIREAINRSEADFSLRAGRMVPENVKALVDERYREVEAATLMRLGKLLEELVAKQFAVLEARVNTLHEAYMAGVTQVNTLVKSLPSLFNPVVNVHVPEQPAPVITVNPDFHYNAPDVVVTDKAFHIQVDSRTTLEQPPPRTVKTEKSIIYDPGTGRPSKVVEEVTEN